ncbi:MAG: DUF11 domain-containing protein [Clostridia bacterium]|nr:DUF11 domain-containing protein [Clostridia bacterium]
MAIFSNQATLTYNGTTTSSNIAYGEILEVLSVTKTSVGGSYTPGELVTYAVTLRNTGNAPQSGLTVSDNLGGYDFGGTTVYPLTYEPGSATFFIDGVLQTAPAVTAGPPLIFNAINVPGGSDAVLIYQARVNSFASPAADGTITNTATVSGAGLDQPISVSQTVNGASAPALSISKSISPTQVVDNDRVTYTFIIQNTGNLGVIATDNASISDLFSPILSDLAVTFNGTAWSQGTEYSYDGTTGLFTTVPGQLTVPAAVYTQNPVTGEYVSTPGIATLVVTGTI